MFGFACKLVCGYALLPSIRDLVDCCMYDYYLIVGDHNLLHKAEVAIYSIYSRVHKFRSFTTCVTIRMHCTA